jgi:hypothetical protein
LSQPLTEVNTRNLARSKVRSKLKTDDLTAICEPIIDLINGNNYTLTFNNTITKARSKVSVLVVGLERGPLSLVSTTEELLDRKIAAPV